jgi:hypothetical protein
VGQDAILRRVANPPQVRATNLPAIPKEPCHPQNATIVLSPSAELVILASMLD